MFLININDLPKCINSIVRLFADDCVIYRNVVTECEELRLQKDFDKVKK